MPKKVKKKKSNVGKIFLILFLVLCIGGLGGGFFYVKSSLEPVNKGKQEVFVVEEGQDFKSVLKNLEKEGFIRNATIAELYAKLNDDFNYYAGNFELKDSMSTPEILKFLSDVKNAKRDAISCTVPEGAWARDIAERIEKTFGYSKEEVLSTWNDMDYIKTLAKDYPFLNVKEIDNPEYRVKLEGYLFPDTYMVDVGSSLDTITRTMLNRFNDVYTKYEDEFKKSDYTVHELVTLASVVLFETADEADMPKIAGVFYNRLNQDMMLQSSATVCYALYDEFTSQLDCEVKVDVDSPYNSYMYKGLPVGPVLNPGEAAIKAVLYPEKTDYLYCLAYIFGDGKVYYSKTLEEHEQKMKEFGLEL